LEAASKKYVGGYELKGIIEDENYKFTKNKPNVLRNQTLKIFSTLNLHLLSEKL